MSKASIFQPKKSVAQKTVNIKVSGALYERMGQVKERLTQVASHLSFNVSAICAEALENAIRRAEQELDKMEQEKKEKKG